MIEQLGVRRFAPGEPPVVRRGHQSLPEEVQPDAVHHYSGSQGVVLGSQPISQLETTAFTPSNGGWTAPGQYLQEPTRHFLGRLLDVAPDQRVRVDRLARFQYAHGLCCRYAVLIQFREGGLDFGNAAADVGQLRLRGLFVVSGGSPGLNECAVLVLQTLDVGWAESVLFLHGVRQGKLDQVGDPSVLGGPNCSVVGFGAEKDSRQGVVIGRRDRVILVVVAAGARNRQSQHDLAHGVDLLVHQVHLELARIAFVESLGAHGQKSRGDEMFLPNVIRLGGQHVPGDLFPNEFVVGLVRVEGIEDVVAVAPGMRVGDVDVLAGRFRVAGDVQPVASPTFAELRALEQLVHLGGDSGFRIAPPSHCEGGQLLRCGR